jgi:integrase
MKTWSVEELRTFLGAISKHRISAAYRLAATTGMRRGEILGVRWTDLNLEYRRMAVRQTVISVNYQIVIGQPKTNRGRRSIALDSGTMQALEAHRLKQQVEKDFLGPDYHDQGFVFAKPDGSPLNPDYFSQLFDRTVVKLPITKIRLHDLRHTHATLGLTVGIPVKVMSDRLGHATTAFTQDVYMHVIPQMDSDAADQIAAPLDL